jgi:hypothetical protein
MTLPSAHASRYCTMEITEELFNFKHFPSKRKLLWGKTGNQQIQKSWKPTNVVLYIVKQISK